MPLSIVATPIGNLKDITLRALEELKCADLILCEDTRVTKKLLNHFEIDTPTMSYHQHSNESKIQEIVALLESGKHLALVTDAGTPGISDPGNELIQQVTKSNEQITIIPVPGPSAVIAALSVSGFATDKFTFLGFPPHKKKRKQFFEEVAASPYTTVFYESPYRIEKAIVALAEVSDPQRSVCICRELTKKFESIYRGTISEIQAKVFPSKGEFVVVVDRK